MEGGERRGVAGWREERKGEGEGVTGRREEGSRGADAGVIRSYGAEGGVRRSYGAGRAGAE